MARGEREDAVGVLRGGRRLVELVRKVEYFNGWFMSFRRAVFEHERFDERLSGYAFKEDIDFSYRVAKRGYVLVQTPRAKIVHHKTPSERLSPFDHQRMALANQFYLHRKNMPQTLHNKAALWWARRDAAAQRRQGRADARPGLPDRVRRRRVGAGAGSGPDRPGGGALRRGRSRGPVLRRR